MRILVLSKRQYTNRDLIDDRFGRLRELPLALASSGDNVTGVCLSYRLRDEGRRDDAEAEARVIWHTVNIQRLAPWGSKSYWRAIGVIGREFRPDLVWACSDSLHAVLAVNIARRLGAALVTDLYDNFESFSLTRLPGMTGAFRRALRRADGITCVSNPLAQYVRDTSLCQCPIEVVENAVPQGLFHPMDKINCRQSLGLPREALLIGTAGAISRSRGIETLFQAFEKFSRGKADAYLVLAGACDRGLRFLKHPRVRYLGMLPPPAVPVLLSALDIAVVCNRESAFGKYCFPQKFYESIACAVPVIAARTAALREVLKDYPGNRFKPDDVESLLAAIRQQADRPAPLPIPAPTWTMRAGQLKLFFEKILGLR